MTTLEKIIKEKNKRLVSIPDKFYSAVQKSESKVYTRLLELIDKLKVDANGNYLRTKSNLTIAQEITNELKKVLYTSEYLASMATFIGQFDEQELLNESYFKKAFPEFTGSEFASQLVTISKNKTKELLTGTSIDLNFFKPIDDVLVDAIGSGASRIDTLKAIRASVTGNADYDGKLLRYSKQIAHDAFAVADRSYSNIIADDLGIEWYFYSGDTIETSRPFCVERHNKYYHKNEIQSWGEGKNLGKVKDSKTGLWKGAMRGTNKFTIFNTAGGYNCDHSIIGVSIFDVPKTVVKKAIKDGFYKPEK